jgi:hypothetical protein
VNALLERVEPVLVRRLFRLPPKLLQALAGKPVVVDGQRLDGEPQLLLRLQKLAGRGGRLDRRRGAQHRQTASERLLVGGAGVGVGDHEQGIELSVHGGDSSPRP